jgi:hypothetical protein
VILPARGVPSHRRRARRNTLAFLPECPIAGKVIVDLGPDEGIGLIASISATTAVGRVTKVGTALK